MPATDRIKFKVVGALIGEPVPDREITIGQFKIYPATPEEVRRHDQFRPIPQAHAEGFPRWLAMRATEVTYRGIAMIEGEVRAPSIDQAQDEVMRELGAL